MIPNEENEFAASGERKTRKAAALIYLSSKLLKKFSQDTMRAMPMIQKL